jgi:molecular chaperone Hsp33
VEALPNPSDSALERMEANIATLGSFREFISDIKRPEEIAECLMAGFVPELLREIPVAFHCPCTQERVIKAILSVGREEAVKMVSSGKDLEVFCDYCRKRYVITPAAIQQAISYT